MAVLGTGPTPGALLLALNLGVARPGQSHLPKGRPHPTRTSKTNTVGVPPRFLHRLVTLWFLQGERLPEEGASMWEGELRWRVSRTPRVHLSNP